MPERAGAAAIAVVAESLFQAGAHDSSAALFRIALDSARAAGDVSREARALTWLGLAAYRMGDYEAARSIGRQARDLKLRHKLDDDLYQSYNALGLVAWQESRYNDAVSNFDRAIALAEARADTVSLARTWNNLALALIEFGDYGRARTLLEQGLAVARQRGERRIEGRILTNLGMLSVRTGSPAAAFATLHQARDLAAAENDYPNHLNVLGQLASAHGAVGEPGVAIAYLDSALRQSRDTARGSPLEEASTLAILGETYAAAGDHVRALRSYEESMALDDSLGLPHERAAALRDVASIHAALGNLDAARRAVSSALVMHRELGTRLELVWDLLVLAELQHTASEKAEVQRAIREASRLASLLGTPAAIGAVRLGAARLADRDRNSARVLQLLKEADDFAAGWGSDRAWEVHYLRMRAHRRRGERDAALAAGQQSLAALERIRGDYGSGLLRTAYLSDRSDVFGEVVELLYEAGRVSEALAVADAARGRAVAEHVATQRDGNQPTIRELAEEERHLLAQVDALAERLAEVRGRAGAAAEDADLQLEQERTAALLERTRSAYDEVLVRTRRSQASSARLDVRALQASLGSDEALVAFLVADSALFTFVVRRDTVAAVRAAVHRDDLATRARVARDLAGRPDAPSSAVRSTFTALGRLLFADTGVRLAIAGRARLTVVPHADLVYVPFPAIIDPGTGRYLAEEFTIVQVPSASLLPMLRQRVPRPVVSSATAFAPFPDALPFAAAEVRSIRPAGIRVKSVVGPRATERAIRQAFVEGGIIHASTHGILNAANPLFSRIELVRGRSRAGEVAADDDGRLEVHEVLGLSTRSPLVFLSGCETGAGPAGLMTVSRGEDYATLSQAFLLAGADNVIATLWRVQDDAAAQFAMRFYSALGRSGDVSGAVAVAQRALLTDPRFAAPYFWAGYTLSGTGLIGARAESRTPSVP